MVDHPHREDVWPFLSAIAAQPRDALPRIVFTYWLEERGFQREADYQRGVIPSAAYHFATCESLWDELLHSGERAEWEDQG
jgi:uncharacterized protein (TIGR02996 family)